MNHERTTHIDVKYYFIWDILALDDIIVSKVGSKNNSTNMLTKYFPATKFKLYLDLVDIHN